MHSATACRSRKGERLGQIAGAITQFRRVAVQRSPRLASLAHRDGAVEQERRRYAPAGEQAGIDLFRANQMADAHRTLRQAVQFDDGPPEMWLQTTSGRVGIVDPGANGDNGLKPLQPSHAAPG